MVKDIKYVIKRILIGVGIALILASLKGGLILGVQAMQVSSYSMGTNYYGVNNMSTRIDHSIEGNPWSVHANSSGYINFNFSVMKVSGNSTAPLVQPRGVSVATGSNSFICNFGSVSSNNSTFNSQVYSVRCPVTMSSSGLTGITILFQDFQANDTSDYRVTLTSGMSFEIVENGDVNVNVDTSNTTNAINNQINNDNTNTQSIINNQNSNKQDLINNQNQNTQNIINNQNSNTDKEIESQKSCTTYDNTYTILRGYINSNGEYVSDTSSSYSSNFIPINSSNSIKVLRSSSGNYRLCFYDDSKSLISCVQFKNYSVGSSITIPNGSYYIRYALERSANAPRFELCKNGNQAIVDSQKEINNTLNDDTGGEVSSSFFDDFNVDSNSPVSDLLTMPITLLQAYIDGFSGTCRDINLGRLYGHNLIMPCINPGSYLGTELWSLIDSLFTIFMIYNIAMLCITIYEDITSLHDAFSWLYGVEARHAGAPSTRVERNSDLY